MQLADARGAGAARDRALQHRGHLVGGDRVHHPLGIGMHHRLDGVGDVVGGAALARPLVVAVDRPAVAVLYPVDQGRLDPEPAVREHRVGRHHLVERGLARPERIAEKRRHVVVDAETLAVLRDGVHADVLGDAHGHQVARLLDAGAHRRRAVVGVARVLRLPDPRTGRHLDRRVEHDRRRAVTLVERRGVDEGLERRPRLAQRLRRAVEDAGLVREPALHRQHAPGLGVHRHEPALDRRDLAIAPMVEGAVLLDRLHQHDVADVPEVVGSLRLAQPAAVAGTHPRPAGLGKAQAVRLAAVGRVFDADPRAALVDR